MSYGTAYANSSPPSPPIIDSRRFGQGMAIIRIFFGLIIFANGLAKLDAGWAQIDVGVYHANLITRDGARNILNFETNQRQVKNKPNGTQVPYLKRFVNNVILAHWNIFQWFTIGIEVGAGALLILGLTTRLAALADFGQQIFLALVYASSNRWLFEQPHEYVPLIALMLVPAGRVWGIDALLVRASDRWRRWPF